MEARAISECLCRNCGTDNFLTATKCWVCGSTDLARHAFLPTPLPAKPEPIYYLGDADFQPPQARNPFVSYAKIVVAIFCAILGGLFLLGIWQEAPGLALVIAMLIGGAILVTMARNRKSIAQDGDRVGSFADSIWRVFGGIMITLATVAILATIAIVAAVVFLLISCYSMLGK